MARLDYVNPERAGEASRAQFARLPINLTRMLIHAPEETAGFLDMVNAFRHGALDPRLRETIILRVAANENSLYQRIQHLAAAGLAGLSGDEVDAITRGDLTRLDPRLAVAVRFVDECVTRVRVSDTTFSDAQKVFSPREIVEITLLTGFYIMTAHFLATLDIDLDAAPADWAQSDRLHERSMFARWPREGRHRSSHGSFHPGRVDCLFLTGIGRRPNKAASGSPGDK